MKKLVLTALYLLSAAAAYGVELGAGYNEQIGDIYSPLIVESGSRWVRAYVNIPRNYLTYADPTFTTLPNIITGVVEDNIYQEPDHVSSYADVLAAAAIDHLIFTKSASTTANPIKIILSLKHDFTYPYVDTPPYGIVPDSLAQREIIFDAITQLLETNDRGAYIDILVVGNEPMFENQPNDQSSTATKYINYLDFLIPALNNLKATKGWAFDVYVGALNHPTNPSPPSNTILPAILNFLQTSPYSPMVAGVDLHEHVMEPSDVLADILYVQEFLQPHQKIISTEFSLIQLWQAHLNDPLGAWGAKNGYPEDWKLYTWLNFLMDKAAVGNPISQSKFMSYFEAQPWYPRHWFKTMMQIFEELGVYAVTYGLQESPDYPWSKNYLNPQSTPWVLNGVYNGTLLGLSKHGRYNKNPLVYPDFRDAIHKISKK